MRKSRYLTAKEAAAELGISMTTLYAYVSRGFVRSEAKGGSKRDRLYHAEDILRLKDRKEARRNPDRVAERALHTGAPVLESAITLITDDNIYYRGQDALKLSTSHTFEQVTALLWTGDLSTELPTLSKPLSDVLSPRCRAVLDKITCFSPIEAFQVLVPLAATEDLSAYDLRTPAVIETGTRLLRLLVASAAGGKAYCGVAETLQQAWAPKQPEAVALLNAALILYADHELNSSTFTARCVASTGATPYAVIAGGLAALSGPNHGTASDCVEALFREVEAQVNVRDVLLNRLKRGEYIHGFGHTVYKDVDPRARILLDQIEATYTNAPALKLTQSIIQEVHSLTTLRYNIDLVVATLARILNLPVGGATALFALGRMAGWIGHAIEQYELGRLIRPRARYVGPQPVEQ